MRSWKDGELLKESIKIFVILMFMSIVVTLFVFVYVLYDLNTKLECNEQLRSSISNRKLKKQVRQF